MMNMRTTYRKSENSKHKVVRGKKKNDGGKAGGLAGISANRQHGASRAAVRVGASLCGR